MEKKPKPGSVRLQEKIDEMESEIGSVEGPVGAADFEGVTPPDPDDPLDALDYARKLNVIMLQQIAKDQTLPNKVRWAYMRETIKALGMTHSKALVEHKLGKLARARGKPKEERVPDVIPAREGSRSS